jgi:hypothetical protein
MCEDCTNTRNEIRADLLALLQDDPDNQLVQAVEKNLPEAEKQIWQRIEKAISEGAVDEAKRPDEDEVREAVRDCLVGAVLATGAAAIARSTPGYTDEGGLPASMILGTWAGEVMKGEMSREGAELARHLLGMGDN